ncbi:hypothetical protein Taro_030645 [Colocasia esculenta]|uniref:CCHC-type domain-containing protein n=1 Tax=Colocasia esculenta TaxID=4460 RepID=A0A843VLW6_COLES|nr:hypothetical protein [Colocasia esculenta]
MFHVVCVCRACGFVYVASSTTPTVVTSPVGCPRFFVSQVVSSGLCPGTCVVPSRSVSSDLDTLTPVLELYVRLRERRQWWCLVGLHSCLTFSRGAAAGPFVRGCETESRHTLLYLWFLVSSVLGEFPTEPVTSEAHPYPHRDKWTDEDKKKISLNSKAKSILCCALSKKEFNRILACRSAMEMWEKLRFTYEGTDKVKETRIDILVAQYERFQMQSGESITQMYSRFTDVTNGLAGLGKTYDIRDMVRKILRSLLASWTPKVIAIEEANNLRRMSLEKLIGSLMAHEINMERSEESSSKKKHSNTLKAIEDTFDGESESDKSNESSEDEEAFLSRRLQRILAKKKYQSGRRYFKKGKDFKRSEGKEVKKTEPICYECKKPEHIKAECPKLKKTEFKKKDNAKKFKRYKKKAMAAAWNNESDSDSESSPSEEEEKANLAFMANVDDKLVFFSFPGKRTAGQTSVRFC